MRRAITMISTSAIWAIATGTAWAASNGDYTSQPSPTTVVRGAHGGTAFTGGDILVPVMIVAVTLMVGMAALIAARRHRPDAA